MMRILYVQYTNPGAYPPLEHSSRILASAGWKVLFLGTESFGASSLDFPPHPNITVERLPFCSAGFRQKIHYVAYCLWVLAWVISWRPRWMYCSDPFSCPVALFLSSVLRVRVIYHEHDGPSTPSTSAFTRFILWARRRLARRADACVLPNERRLATFQVDTGRTTDTFCVRNCPRTDEISGTRASVDESADLWLLYQGSIAAARLPASILEAMARLPDAVKLRVIGYETIGARGYIDLLRDRAVQLNISHRIEFLGTLPTRADLSKWRSRSDIGLALMPMSSDDANMNAMNGASNKAFDYLADGMAVLVSDLPAWRREYVDSGYGLACVPEDPMSIGRAIQWFLNHKTEIRVMGEKGRERIRSEWNYETQFAPVYDVLCGKRDPFPRAIESLTHSETAITRGRSRQAQRAHDENAA
jgi:glycosyltransferase involved in cell wall biosynthesis